VRPIAGATALVSGGAQGIGAAAVRLLASRGAAVLVADVNHDLGEAVEAEVGGTFVALDVTDPEAWTSIPPVDYAFLNAGTMTKATPCELEDLTLSSWSRVRSVNVDGVVNGLLHLLSSMRAQGGGSILLSGSLAGLASYPPDPFYAATKSLVVSLARSIGDRVDETSVRVNAICPGEVATRMLPADRAELLASRGYRPLSADEVAHAAVEILEQEGSGDVWSLVSGRPKERWVFPPIPRPTKVSPVDQGGSEARQIPPNG
jgi:NAD(P)-dependent dehydrogenase (short-subunit alcohol dehydrogenase family)